MQPRPGSVQLTEQTQAPTSRLVSDLFHENSNNKKKQKKMVMNKNKPGVNARNNNLGTPNATYYRNSKNAHIPGRISAKAATNKIRATRKAAGDEFLPPHVQPVEQHALQEQRLNADTSTKNNTTADEDDEEIGDSEDIELFQQLREKMKVR